MSWPGRPTSGARAPRPPTTTLATTALALLALLTVAACARKSQPFAIEKADPATKRTTTSGDVVGGEGRYGSYAWLGIPFAEAPIGHLRWRAPEPPEPWNGTRETLVSGPPCVQYASVFGGVTDAKPNTPAGQEDCLTLNVWTPRFPAGQVPTGADRLPVMVWIHGGGNTIGTASFYEGGRLAAEENVVVVAIQYRLGPFGWMRHPALRADASDDAERSGNFATLDQIRALEWVRDNISAFGGDPNNVTIFGESAGARNVYALVLAPQARGLFHRAIAQSGGTATTSADVAERFADDPAGEGHPQSSNEILLRLLQRDGTAADRAAAKARLAAMSEQDVASYLRGKSAYDILTAYEPQGDSGMINLPRLFADGAVLPTEPLASLARPGAHADVPLMAGTNRDENKLFMFASPEWITYRLWILPRFVDEKMYLTHAEYLARMWKAAGADEPASALRRAGGAEAYVYRFDWDEEPTVLGADLSKMLGAAHAFEIPFVFGHFDLGRAGNMIFTDDNLAGREQLADAMMAYWAEFARTGNPGTGGGQHPQWLPWRGKQTMVFDTPADGGVRMEEIVETREKILADVEQDPRLPSRKERCALYRTLVQSWHFTAEDYWKVAGGSCASFPLDAYPWDDA
ncbi:MAG TPA: carboxylesterase family protein [Candidatus Binatia bacterium]